MKNFSDFSDLDAIKNHPVSGQIDQIFKQVIKEEVMPKAAEALALSEEDTPAEHNDQELSLSDDGEFELNLGGDEAPPQDMPQDDGGFELSLDSDESLDLADPMESSEDEGQEEQYGELSLGDGDDDLSLDSFEEAEDAPAIENLGELSFDESGDELSLGGDELSLSGSDDSEAEGLSLGDDDGLSLGGDDELSLGGDDLSLGGDEPSLGDDNGLELVGDGSDGLSLSDDIPAAEGLSLGDDEPVEGADDLALSFGNDDGLSLSEEEADLSDDAKEKLKEIDAIMDLDASQVNITPNLAAGEDDNLDEPLVSPDLNLDSLDFSADESTDEIVPVKEEKSKKKKKEAAETREARDKNIGDDLREISGAYSGEMERMQATISNLRADREELLMKIQKMEDDKVLQSRQTLSMRAELDERKIELTIIRRKLNEEINELKDRLKLHDEKRLILEEKNRLLHQELDKAAQKNKIDVKKVQMRERELEQKLELLKADAETQIRNRDLKILELKRKIDAMEFDMESISQQEKRSVESRYELEDKLDKAIKTLRSAITVLEDESDRSNALSALKKNIDM